MSKRVGNILVRYGNIIVIMLEAEKPQQCDFCGEIAELRPYGPKGEAICFDCGMKDKASTRQMMSKVLFGDD